MYPPPPPALPPPWPLRLCEGLAFTSALPSVSSLCLLETISLLLLLFPHPTLPSPLFLCHRMSAAIGHLFNGENVLRPDDRYEGLTFTNARRMFIHNYPNEHSTSSVQRDGTRSIMVNDRDGSITGELLRRLCVSHTLTTVRPDMQACNFFEECNSWMTCPDMQSRHAAGCFARPGRFMIQKAHSIGNLR